MLPTSMKMASRFNMRHLGDAKITFTGCAEQENCASDLCLFARDAPDRRTFRSMKNRTVTGGDATPGRSTRCESEHRDRVSRGTVHIVSLHNAKACRNFLRWCPAIAQRKCSMTGLPANSCQGGSGRTPGTVNRKSRTMTAQLASKK
jgi:hypothetical protein